MKKLTVILFIFVLFISTPAISLHGFCNVPRKGDVKGNLVVIFNGPHNKTTPVFKVKPHWQIRYHTLEPDRHFSIVVHDEYGKYISLAANEIGPKEGLYYQEKGGTYYLDVTADGNWRAEIIQLPKKRIKKLKAKVPNKGEEIKINRLTREIVVISQEINDMIAYAHTNNSHIRPDFLGVLLNNLELAIKAFDMIDELYKAGQFEKAIEVARPTVAMLKTMKIEFKKELLPEKEKLLNQLGYVNENAVFPQHYIEYGGLPHENMLYEAGTTIKLHNLSDTSVAIYKDEALGNITNLFTNGIKATITDFKTFPDKPIAYKVQILLKDGSKYTGWISGNIISHRAGESRGSRDTVP